MTNRGCHYGADTQENGHINFIAKVVFFYHVKRCMHTKLNQNITRYIFISCYNNSKRVISSFAKLIGYFFFFGRPFFCSLARYLPCFPLPVPVPLFVAVPDTLANFLNLPVPLFVWEGFFLAWVCSNLMFFEFVTFTSENV